MVGIVRRIVTASGRGPLMFRRLKNETRVLH
jgi:hypothetical protein